MGHLGLRLCSFSKIVLASVNWLLVVTYRYFLNCEFVASHDQRTVKERSLRSGRLVGISQQLLISPTAFVVVTDLADVRGRHPLPQGYIGDCQADKCIFCFSPHRIVSFFPSFSTLNLCTIYHHGPTRLFQRSAGLISIHLIHLRLAS